MDRRDIDDANRLLDYRESGMTWKHWAFVAVAGTLFYLLMTLLRS